MTHFFRVKVAKVEERFEKVYDVETLASAKGEDQVKYELVSSGWFVTLEGWGVAVRFGHTQPEFKAGDTLITGWKLEKSA
jgi:hypothetical protein